MLPLWIVLALLPILGGAERFNCRGRILGAYYADAKSGCKAFHVCVRVAGGGVRDFRFFCPPGTLFHQEAQTCTDWGDDDPLACPADLYDGQFDLYKIGSGFDTKKLSSQGTRDEEAEFGLQRAETGDRRSQNSVNNGPVSDLRAAHSSDFFSGQRDRGRDDSAPPPAPASRPTPQSSSRQSFRRVSTRVPPTTTEYTTTPPPPQPSKQPQHDGGSKRKLVRKRPIYVSTQAPTTFAENNLQQSFPPNQNNPPPAFAPKQNNAPQTFKQNNPPQSFKQNNPPQSFQQNNPPQSFQQNNPPQSFQQNNPPQSFKQNNPPQSFQQQPQQSFAQQPFDQKPNNVPQNNFQQQPQQQQNLNNRGPPRQTTTLAPPNVNVPPQYKDEYVEVPRVAPKQPKNRYFPNNPTPAPITQSSPAQNFNKKDNLVELYKYEAQSTPGLSTQNENRPFKVRNNFQVQDGSREDFARINSNNGRITPTTEEHNTASTRSFTTTPTYRNKFNSVSYEPEKDNYVPYSRPKQNYYNSPTTTPTTTAYTSPPNLNTIAYNTNIALNTIQPANYGSNEEDDGQYRPPEGEDDGQYRPELYERERELLSGAHSINIAASGNRLYEEEKSHEKSQFAQKPSSKISAPRPFRPAPTPTLPPTTTHAPEPTYTTTYRAPTTNAQRTFDYFQTYTTTVRPSETPAPAQFSIAPEYVNNAPVQPTSTSPPKTPERPQSRAPAPPTVAPPRLSNPPPPSNPPPKPNPAHKQDDSSYDYAYYDSDSGFSEYDHIEEFGRTKTRS